MEVVLFEKFELLLLTATFSVFELSKPVTIP